MLRRPGTIIGTPAPPAPEGHRHLLNLRYPSNLVAFLLFVGVFLTMFKVTFCKHLVLLHPHFFKGLTLASPFHRSFLTGQKRTKKPPGWSSLPVVLALIRLILTNSPRAGHGA